MVEKNVQPKIRVVTAVEDVDQAMQVRYAVFIKEMGFEPYQMFGVQDLEAEHLVAETAESGTQAVGSAQLFHGPDQDVIGGLAVLPAYRRRGIGSALMKALLEMSHARKVMTHCPAELVPFCEKQGFKPEGDVFLLGIMEQQKMVLERTFEEWKGNHEQVDDVLLIGVRV